MQYGHFYDFTALFLFSLGVLLIARQSWNGYLVTFALGTLNKETTILLYLVFAMYCLARMPRRQFVMLSAAQLGVYATIQSFLRYRFRENGGAGLPWVLGPHMEWFGRTAADTPWLLLTYTAIVALTAIAVAYGWRHKPPLLRAALSVVPFFLVLFVGWGYELEIRAMMEVYPIIVLLAIPPAFIGMESNRAATLKTQPEPDH
jgi:hypothetical protein